MINVNVNHYFAIQDLNHRPLHSAVGYHTRHHYDGHTVCNTILLLADCQTDFQTHLALFRTQSEARCCVIAAHRFQSPNRGHQEKVLML